MGSVVRFARFFSSESPGLQTAIELAEYGMRLSPQFQFPGDPPFDEYYKAHLNFFRILAGDWREEAIAYFRERLKAAAETEDRRLIAYVLVDLLVRIGAKDEAVAVAKEFLADLDESSGFSFAQLCEEAERMDVYRQTAQCGEIWWASRQPLSASRAELRADFFRRTRREVIAFLSLETTAALPRFVRRCPQHEEGTVTLAQNRAAWDRMAESGSVFAAVATDDECKNPLASLDGAAGSPIRSADSTCCASREAEVGSRSCTRPPGERDRRRSQPCDAQARRAGSGTSQSHRSSNGGIHGQPFNAG